jgi:hypothetical protein
MRPGEQPFTRTPLGASSFAIAFVNDMTPPLAAAYASAPGPPPLCAATDETLTIVPLPRSTMPGAAACVTKKTLDRLRSITWRQSASDISASGLRSIRSPALLTRMSIAASCLAAASTTAVAASRRATSPDNATALRPSAWTRSTVSRAPFSLRW